MKHVAVIDDNPDQRELIGVILAPIYEVTQYEDGHQALDAFRTEVPDLVILDISLPRMDGAEVVREIRAGQKWRNIPVIALTGHAMVGDREKYLAAGFDDYVTKPILDEGILLQTVERWIAAGLGQKG
ncbi:MAG TPA: response regulator [Acidobacteriota bacterium]|nr:response regulator [Acidobacteriota bacterium]